ncbi:hypothetical protein ACWD2L_00660 [Streptomyces sp. NPDC002754]
MTEQPNPELRRTLAFLDEHAIIASPVSEYDEGRGEWMYRWTLPAAGVDSPPMTEAETLAYAAGALATADMVAGLAPGQVAAFVEACRAGVA